MENNLLRRRILAKIGGEAIPDSLTSEDIARLACSEDWRKEGEFLEIIQSAIKAGEIETDGMAKEWFIDDAFYDSKLVHRYALKAWLGDSLPGEAVLLRYWLSAGETEKRKPEAETMKRREDQQDKVDCQAIATKIWKESPTLTITGAAGMAGRQELTAYKKKYPVAFVKWLREVAPVGVRNKRGRPKKNSQPPEK